MTDSTSHIAWFRRLDRLFWVLWAALPVMIFMTYRSQLDAGVPLEGMTPEQMRCFEILPTIKNLSVNGKSAYWVYFAFEHIIYFLLLAILHRMVHRFASGSILVSETLSNTNLMGMILVAWPFLQLIAGNLLNYIWNKTGDFTAWNPIFNVDIAPIAVGVFLIALKGVLEHAIALKTENDLTI